jgi:GDP-L-fucose synthase
MRPDAKIYVAGHRGLAGSAIARRLARDGYRNVLVRPRVELDLTDSRAVDAFFQLERPEYVFLAAARVGGILANASRPADFVRDNLLIQTNVIHAAFEAQVRKLLFLGSSCIYPKHCPQPMRESYLLAGALEPTNEAYAIAKIAGIKMCAAYNRQHGTNFLCVMPANLYGPGDNYDPVGSHVLPALIGKAHEAKRAGASELVVWGSGTPRREFLYSDDLADACVFLMREHDAAELGESINVGAGTDLTIRELAEAVARAVGFEGALAFDREKPDGTPQKLLDVARLAALGWRAATPLAAGIRLAYDDYLARFGGRSPAARAAVAA